MSRAHSLFRLQEIDLVLDKNNARLDEIEAILKDSTELQRAKATLDQTDIHLKEVRSTLKGAEYAVESQRKKIEETEATLYGGTITNPKELQDLQMEAESLKRYLSTLEDRLLDVMVEMEQAELEQEAAHNVVKNLQQSLEVEHQELRNEQYNLQLENERLRDDREVAVVSVLQEDLELYEKLRQKPGGIVIAILEDDGNCSMCGLSISASRQQLIRSGTKIEQCKQCRRILYAG